MSRIELSRTQLSRIEEALFRLPLEEFIAARKALAGQLKASGQAAEAKRIEALIKPSLSAWAVNQIHWQHPAVLARLVRTSDVLRDGWLDPGVRAQATRDRRAALQSAVAKASTLLEEAGHGTAQNTMRRVSTTLQTIASSGNHPDVGFLARDLEAAGFDALADMAAFRARGTAPAKRVPVLATVPDAPDPRVEAQTALDGALAMLVVRRREATDANTGAQQARRRAEASRGEFDEALRRVERAEKAVRETAEAEARGSALAEGARQRLAEAEGEETAAREHLKRLS
ncbi:MAG: hypothetical protein ACI9WU_003585 [Myxococcota bacterium]